MIRRLFTIDLRVLAFYRIALGLVVLGDLFFRLPHWLDWYSDQGVLPRLAVMRHYVGEFQWSFHLSGGSAVYCYAMFAVHVAVMLAFIMGYKFRVASVLAWLLCYSLQNRNLLVLNGGDALQRMMLFWCMFLPIGDRYSVDSRWDVRPGQVFSVSTVAVIVQVLCVYWFGVLYKTGDTWTVEKSAVWLSLSNPELVTGLGSWLSGYPVFCKWLTGFTVWIEVLAPVFMLQRFGLLRLIGIVALAGLHVGIAATLTVGVFSFVCLANLVLFWPWARVLYIVPAELRPDPSRYNMWYLARSSLCALCLAFVLVYNTSGYFGWPFKSVPGVMMVRNVFGLGQRWQMYAPDPPKNSYRLDVIGDRDFYFLNQRPYGNSSRWRTYLARLRSSSYRSARGHYANYVQRVSGWSPGEVRMVLFRQSLDQGNSRATSLGKFVVGS